MTEDKENWQAPVPMQTDGKEYNWNENQLQWVEVVATPTMSSNNELGKIS